MKLSCETLVLGSGVSAFTASSYLETTNRDYLICPLTDDRLSLDRGPLKTYKWEDQNYNILPIFATLNSHLSQMFKYYNVDYRDFVEPRIIYPSEISPEISEYSKLITSSKAIWDQSYYRYLKRKNTNDNVILLSEKLFGEKIFFNSLLNVKDKVKRHYTGVKSKKMGFSVGVSPYSLLFVKALPYLEGKSIAGKINNIDFNKRIINISGTIISYKKLISCIPIERLLKLIYTNTNLNSKFISKNTRFSVFYVNEDMKTNLVIYDKVVDSGVYRIFTPTKNILIVQHSNRQGAQLKDSDVRNIISRFRICENFSIMKIDTVFMPNAYPLNRFSFLDRKSFICSLNRNAIHLFGRVSEWKYIDIHEFNWNGI
jgi:hypothetical protein